MSFPTGQKDVDREILSKLPDEDVIKSCSSNSYLREKVCDEGFFKRRLDKNYPELRITVGEKFRFGSYKQAYLETVYYISKMKEIGYDYVRNGEVPKSQYYKAKRVYDTISKLKIHKYESWRGVVPLLEIIRMDDLNLIKYALKLYNFDEATRRNALSNANTRNLNIVKYFADLGGLSSNMIRIYLEHARKTGDAEMIKYFESKI